jgi:hypothetical protein
VLRGGVAGIAGVHDGLDAVSHVLGILCGLGLLHRRMSRMRQTVDKQGDRNVSILGSLSLDFAKLLLGFMEIKRGKFCVPGIALRARVCA